MKTKATVSVIIPLYNQKQYIARAIESVLKQDIPHIEIIVVDDGSTDSPCEILKRFGEKIRVIRQENGGLAAARNRGIKEASGTYIQFLDSDDTLLPGKLVHQIKILEDHAVDLTACRCNWVDESGKLLWTQKIFEKRSPVLADFLWENQFPVHSVLLKKDALEETGFFDKDMNPIEDWDMWIRMIINGKKLICSQFVGCEYFQLSSSMSTDSNAMCAARRRLIKKYIDEISCVGIREEILANTDLHCGRGAYLRGETEKAREYSISALTKDTSLLADFSFFNDMRYFSGKGEEYSDTEETVNFVQMEQKKILDALFEKETIPSGVKKRALSHSSFALAVHYKKAGCTEEYKKYFKKSLRGNALYIFTILYLCLSRSLGRLKNG